MMKGCLRIVLIASLFISFSLCARKVELQGKKGITYDKEWKLPQKGLGIVMFKVRGDKVVKIGLREGVRIRGREYEIKIGIEKSSIKDREKTGPEIESKESSVLLTKNKDEYFWVKVDKKSNAISVGRGIFPEGREMLKLKDDTFNENIQFIGFGGKGTHFSGIKFIEFPKIVLSSDFKFEGGIFESVGSAGMAVFASGADGELYLYLPGAMDKAWEKIKTLDLRGEDFTTDKIEELDLPWLKPELGWARGWILTKKMEIKDKIVYVTGFGSKLYVLTQSGQTYKYHWTSDEARKFLPVTSPEKKKKLIQIKEKRFRAKYRRVKRNVTGKRKVLGSKRRAIAKKRVEMRKEN